MADVDLLMVLLIITLPAVGGPDPAQQPAPLPPQVVRPVTANRPSRFTPFAVAFTAFDSNVNHDAQDLDAFGGALGIGGIFRNDPRRPTLEVQYQAGLHRYTSTDRWNRLSHYARTAWNRRLNRRLALEAVGEVSIKGTTEDRELSNQFIASPRVEFRLTPALRLRALGAWRVKRYEDDPGRNAFNRYLGLAFIGRPRAGVRWDAGGRYELNAAESVRQRFLRWTWFGGLSAPVRAHDRLEVEMRYMRQRYPYRLVDVRHGPDVPRRDWRVEPEISWLHSVDEDVDLRIGYAFSGRNSNDPRRDYRSHQVLFSLMQRW